MNAFSNPPPEFENDIVTLDMCTPQKIQLECDIEDERFAVLSAFNYGVAGVLGGLGLIALWGLIVIALP